MSWITLDKQVILEGSMPLQLLLFFVGAFFVFSIEYPTEAGATLEFMQR